MAPGFADLESLSRDDLLAVAHDYMLAGMLTGSALGPIIALHGGIPDGESLPIDQWMGASPVYTNRMRRLMGIEGHDVPAIMKALQLDTGFVHGYMDVGYQVIDPEHGEFWLVHCGALMMVEPLGEARVIHMCHTIEDPTFDATALATNPRARIRPIHRPPRVPEDRHPHCHWTIQIDEANEPVGAIPLTEHVGSLPVASVPNAMGDDTSGGPLADYRGPLEPAFRLRHLTNGALAAVAREFHVQAHILATSSHVAVARRTDDELANDVTDRGWLAWSWILAERLGRLGVLGTGVDAVVRAIELTAAIPPGFDRTVSVDGNRITCTLEEVHPGVLDAAHPGWCGSLSRGATAGIEGTVNGVGYAPVGISVDVSGNRVRLEVEVEEADPDRPVPDTVTLGRFGGAANWKFDLTDASV
jgi:hypothetical protein